MRTVRYYMVREAVRIVFRFSLLMTLVLGAIVIVFGVTDLLYWVVDHYTGQPRVSP